MNFENRVFWVITKRVFAFPYRRFGTTYRSIFKGQESKRKPGTLVGVSYKEQ